jgi:hypothetical protein
MLLTVYTLNVSEYRTKPIKQIAEIACYNAMKRTVIQVINVKLLV